MKTVKFTQTGVGWEEWVAEVPDDADEDWVRENFFNNDKLSIYVNESGLEAVSETSIEMDEPQGDGSTVADL